MSKIQVKKTVYNHSEATYTIDNFVLELNYNDGKQKIEIGDYEDVTVTNGTVFFGYKFNYSVSSKTRNVNGWAHGKSLINLRFCIFWFIDIQKAFNHQQWRFSWMGTP